MFRSIKLYIGGQVARDELLSRLAEFSYRRQENTSEEGDFSCRGNIIDIYPFTFEFPIRIELDVQDIIISVRTFHPLTGEILFPHTMTIILPVNHSFLRRGSSESLESFRTGLFKEDVPLDNFVDLAQGDFIVHNQHGIGKFLGFEKIKVKDKLEPHLAIEYENKEKLYVPASQMNLVQKYISFKTRSPKLHKLGSKQWERTKLAVRKGIQKLAWDLLTLQAMRMSLSGFCYSPSNEMHRQFEENFPFEETPDQARACQEVSNDMEKGKLMDRLLCGDVGYGKTEVAMRAAFKAIIDNKQVAYLVPTTILAQQHYENFSGRFKDFAVNIEMLSRFRTPMEQKEIIRNLSEGRVDIIIGTHRLLSDDIKFKDLGLLIIDEEQRFGVKAKEKLKAFRLSTDVLTLTATPIPRTLYMSLMGAKDLSLINTPPQNRLPIKTVVIEYDDDIIREALDRELKRKGQVYFIHNRVKDIEKLKRKIALLSPKDARIEIAHGQMPAHELASVVTSFTRGDIDILVSTMIVESGIDIPNVNTIIINNAYSFGLSDLHQLRGRVGRFNRPAYAYLFIPRDKLLDNDAKRRLEAIAHFTQLGAGFHIAMEDLEIRGAGNLLGIEQHGFIVAVGFDLYCRLLRETIGTFKHYAKNN